MNRATRIQTMMSAYNTAKEMVEGKKVVKSEPKKQLPLTDEELDLLTSLPSGQMKRRLVKLLKAKYGE